MLNPRTRETSKLKAPAQCAQDEEKREKMMRASEGNESVK